MMRPQILFLCAGLPFVLTGCMAEVLTTTAIEGELAARDAQASAQALHYAKDSRAKIEAEQAIRAYQAEKGAYPPSLASLVPNYLASVPMRSNGQSFGYDPATGQLYDGPVPAPRMPAFTQTDQRNLEAIGDAIYRYWEATGQYPRALADLAPLYMERVPRLQSGESFDYDPQTGGVYPPASAQPAAAPVASQQSRGGGAGAGPLGEAVTGIAIQNQLNNMNTSGASGAGSAARGGVNGISDSYNAQQNRALDLINQ